MENLQNLQCRETFFNMLAFGYKTLEEVTAQIDMNEQSFSQLQSLTFNEITENQLLSS